MADVFDPAKRSQIMSRVKVKNTAPERGHRPQTNVEFWHEKIGQNIKRDEIDVIKLNELGWRVLIVWECEIKKQNEDALVLRLKNFLLSETSSE